MVRGVLWSMGLRTRRSGHFSRLFWWVSHQVSPFFVAICVISAFHNYKTLAVSHWHSCLKSRFIALNKAFLL